VGRERVADLIDAESPVLDEGAPLPPMWHWLYLLAHPRSSEIGEDGHPAEGPLLPPIPARRRMFVGGRLQQLGRIPLGAILTGTSSVASVTPRSGNTGEVVFVTVRTDLTVVGDPDPVAVEEQDIAYRSEPAGHRVMARPEGGGPDVEGEWSVRLPTDPVLLARFSALTYNGHRIHVDRSYATTVEGYPDLVVHGPLLALLALELPRRHTPRDEVASFSYRLSRPAFAPAPIIAAGTRKGDAVSVAVAAAGVEPSLTATVRFR
jgi:3-methylfumaryl-CoA hydratase